MFIGYQQSQMAQQPAWCNAPAPVAPAQPGLHPPLTQPGPSTVNHTAIQPNASGERGGGQTGSMQAAGDWEYPDSV